jgi:hypothetical protein
MQTSAGWVLYPGAGFLKRRTRSWLVLTAGTCRNYVYMPDGNTPLLSEIRVYSNLNRYARRELYIGYRILEIVKLVLIINFLNLNLRGQLRRLEIIAMLVVLTWQALKICRFVYYPIRHQIQYV